MSPKRKSEAKPKTYKANYGGATPEQVARTLISFSRLLLDRVHHTGTFCVFAPVPSIYSSARPELD